MTVIYHNPRCSKSRATLELLNQNNIEPDVVLYLNEPLDADLLGSITQKLGLSIRDIMRTGEQTFKDLGLSDDSLGEDDLIQAVINHPILLERPIVVNGDRAAVGRPPENVLSII